MLWGGRLCIGLLIAGTLVAGPTAAEPVTHLDDSLGYSVTLPDAWEIIGGAELTLFRLSALVGGGGLGPSYATGFRPAGGSPGSPYVLVQHHPPLPQTGHELARMMSAVANSSDVQAVAQTQGLHFQSARWDESRGRLYMPLQATGPGMEDWRGLVLMLPSPLGIVQLNFYAPGDRFDGMLPTFDAIADAVVFEPHRRGASPLALWWGLNPILRHTLIGAAVGALVGWLWGRVRASAA